MLNIPEAVRGLFKENSIKKQLRIHFPNGERADITNENIDGENFSFTESLCSRKQMKFGLCEAGVVKFTCTNIENIKGYEIEVFCEIDVSSIITARQSLKSEKKQIILDTRILNLGTPVKISFLERVKYFDYSIEYESGIESGYYPGVVGGYSGFEHTLSSDYGNVVSFTISLERNISAILEYRTDVGFEYQTADDVPFPYYQIPFGVFVVDQCKRNKGSFERRKVVAYGKEMNLSNVSDAEKIKRRAVIGSTYKFNIPNYMISNAALVDVNVISFEKMELQDSERQVESVWVKGNSYLYAKKYYKEYVFDDKKIHELYRITNNIGKDGVAQKLKQHIEVMYNNTAELGYDVQSANRSAFYKFVKDEIYPFFGPLSANYLKDDSQYLYPFVKDNYQSAYIHIPYKIEFYIYDSDIRETVYRDEFFVTEKEITVEKLTTDYVPMEYTIEEYDDSDVDFKKIFEAYVELQGKFGRCDRQGIFRLVSLDKKFGLYPSKELNPGKHLYPSSAGYSVGGAQYSSIWYDDELAKPYGKVIATYTDQEGTEHYIEHLIPKNTDEDGNVIYFEDDECRVYDLSKNAILRNSKFEEAAIKELLEEFVANIKDISYRPAEIEMKGLPYLECGDVLRVRSNTANLQTVILRRTLKGIQSLKDTVESEG